MGRRVCLNGVPEWRVLQYYTLNAKGPSLLLWLVVSGQPDSFLNVVSFAYVVEGLKSDAVSVRLVPHLSQPTYDCFPPSPEIADGQVPGTFHST